jgi:glycosyltransferase involved in cell wall biosynthesis
MTRGSLVHRVAGASVRYGLVGAACALLNLAIVWAGTERLGLPYPVAALATCFVTIPVAYLMHRRFSFRKRGAADRGEWWRFLALQLSQFCIGLAGMAMAVEWLHWRPWLAMAGVSVAMYLYGFAMSGTWVFAAWRPRPRSRSEGAAPRVLQVSAFFAAHVGGLEAVADQLAHRLALAGVPLTWMAGGRPGQEPAPGCGFAVDRADYVDVVEHRIGLPAPVWSSGSLRRLWRHVRECDVVHVHDYLYASSLAAIVFARLHGRPVVLTQHIGEIPFESRAPRLLLGALNRSLGRWALASAAQAVFVGKPVQDYFDGFTTFRRPALLVANGVEHALYEPRADDTPGDDPELHALFVGRFVEKKGVGLLRRCVPTPGVRWDFVGYGPMLDDAWAATQPSARMHGKLEPRAVAAAMRAADVLVLPSKGEGFPLVVQEALSCGTPVLVSEAVAAAFPRLDPGCVWSVDVTGPAEAAAERLRERLVALQADLACVRAARAPARRLAEQWSWDECVAAYLQIYRRLATGTGTAPA